MGSSFTNYLIVSSLNSVNNKSWSDEANDIIAQNMFY